MAIQAVLFDLWGTLIEDSAERREPVRATRLRLVREALRAIDLPYPDEAIGQAFEAFSKEHAAVHAGGRDIGPEERLQQFLAQLRPPIERDPSPAEREGLEAALTGAIWEYPPVAAPGAHEVLDEARRRKLRVALVSNTGITPGYVLRELLRRLGLIDAFDVMTFSDEARLSKPATGMYTCTLDALEVTPELAAFVGDLPHTDVAGALAAGLWAVQIGDKGSGEVQPHARIDGLDELFPELERLGLV